MVRIYHHHVQQLQTPCALPALFAKLEHIKPWPAPIQPTGFARRVQLADSIVQVD